MGFGDFKKIVDMLFYNPQRFVRKHKNIRIDETSILLNSARFIFNNSKTKNNITIGKGSMIGCQFIFESERGEISVGDRTFINGNTKIISRSKISIGSDVTIAWDCTIYDHNSHSIDWRLRRQDIKQQLEDYKNSNNFIANKNWDVVKSKPIIIEDKVWIGFGSTILSGTTIGEGAIIGAMSVVREDVEPWTVIAGNPPHVLYKIDNR